MQTLEKILNLLIIALLFTSMSFSDARLTDLRDRGHILTADHSFDFLTWTIDAVWIKITQSAIASPRYMDTRSSHQIVIEYLNTLDEVQNSQEKIKIIYSDPGIPNPEAASQVLRNQLRIQSNRLDTIAPFAEAVLEAQVTETLSTLGLTTGGQPIPWVLYHSSPLPQNMVISLREKIGQQTNYVLTPITTEEADVLENTVDKKLNVSSLVVNIGGLAAYPTMIMYTTDLNWLSSTIAHEWTHIYLGQRPLGNNYDSPELRTMNETTASIAGTEIGKMVIQQFYPELLSSTQANFNLISLSEPKPKTSEASFDFRSEMRITRVHADNLLAQGKIEEAEFYMEQRRKVFWEHNYAIRKLNQAYFAFYGAYADTPGGAAGEDPVGPAVRALRTRSASLKEFLEKMSVMTSFAELRQAIGLTQ